MRARAQTKSEQTTTYRPDGSDIATYPDHYPRTGRSKPLPLLLSALRCMKKSMAPCAMARAPLESFACRGVRFPHRPTCIRQGGAYGILLGMPGAMVNASCD